MGGPPALIGVVIALLAWLAAEPPAGEGVRRAPSAQEPAQGEPSPPSEGPESPLPGPAPRAPIAGLGGWVSESRVIMPQRPDWPHRFDCTYAFPDRVRWWLSPANSERPGQRRIVYRNGEQAYLLDAGSGDSQEVLGTERFDLFLRMELRRALFLWPDGFEWERDEFSAQADLGTTGRLVATLDEQGRPTSLSSLDREDRPVETLHSIEWREEGGRAWPANLRLRGDQGEVWQEEVLSVRTSPTFLDAFFVPPDRRSYKGRELAEGALVQGLDLPARVERRFPLGQHDDWRSTLESCRDLVKLALEQLGEEGPGIESAFYFELDEEARPRSLVLRIAEEDLSPDLPPPDGWRRHEARPGVSILVQSLSLVGTQQLEVLRAAAGASVPVAARPYLRVDVGEGSSAWAQLVLPLGE